MSGSIGLRQRMVSRANSKKATEARDLIKVTVNLHAIALGHFGNKIAPVALSIALNAGDLVKKGRQSTGVGIAHTAERRRSFVQRGMGDLVLAVFHRPFQHARLCIMNITIKKRPMIREIQGVPNCGTGVFRNHTVNAASTFRHPDAGEPHSCFLFFTASVVVSAVM